MLLPPPKTKSLSCEYSFKIGDNSSIDEKRPKYEEVASIPKVLKGLRLIFSKIILQR